MKRFHPSLTDLNLAATKSRRSECPGTTSNQDMHHSVKFKSNRDNLALSSNSTKTIQTILTIPTIPTKKETTKDCRCKHCYQPPPVPVSNQICPTSTADCMETCIPMCATTVPPPISMCVLEKFRRIQIDRVSGGVSVPSLPCPICFEIMVRKSDAPEKLALLICGHVICAACLKQIESSKRLVCPLCRCNLRNINPMVPIKTYSMPLLDANGTFMIRVNDRDESSYQIPCCWATTFGEILDLIASLRKREFAHIEFPNNSLSIGIMVPHKCQGQFAVFPNGKNLGDIGYCQGQVFMVKEWRLSSSHPIIVARLERFMRNLLCHRVKRSHVFIVKAQCAHNKRPNLEIEANDTMKLVEIAHRLKLKLRSSGVEHAAWYGRDEISLSIYGSVDNGVWNQHTTTLKDLCYQGCQYRVRINKDNKEIGLSNLRHVTDCDAVLYYR